MQYEHSSEKDQKIAFELTCLIPKFWEISRQENIVFSHSNEELAMRYLSHLDLENELSILTNRSINDNEMINSLKDNLANKRWKELAEDEYLLNDYIINCL